MINQSNCSEYIGKITLKGKELLLAKKMAEQFTLGEDDMRYLKERLETDKDAEFDFIEEGIAVPYSYIRDEILRIREQEKAGEKEKEEGTKQ